MTARRRRALVALSVIVALVVVYAVRHRSRVEQAAASRAKAAERHALAASVHDARGALELLAAYREARVAPDDDRAVFHRIAPPPLRRLADLPEGTKRVRILASGDVAVIGATTHVYDLMTGEALPPHAIGDEAPVGNIHNEGVIAGQEVVISWIGSPKPLGRIRGHTAPITLFSLAGWRPVGHLYSATASLDRTVRLWQLRQEQPLVTIAVEDVPSFLWLAPDATRLVIADEAAEDVRIYDVTLDTAVKQLCALAKNEPIAQEVCP